MTDEGSAMPKYPHRGLKCGILVKSAMARLLFQPRERSRCAVFHQFAVKKHHRVPAILFS